VSFYDLFETMDIRSGQHLILHAAYRRIREVYPGHPVENFLEELQMQIGVAGSLIMPAFTYNFKRRGYRDNRFDRLKSPSAVGAVSETFRQMPGVVRTSGPTHSFCLWGKAAHEIGVGNTPESPLGAGSVLEWLADQSDGFVTLIGVDFSSFSFGHYLEHLAPVPWHDFSPWKHLNVMPVGLGSGGDQNLRELPGCSQSFVRFEKYLVDKGVVVPRGIKHLKTYHIPVATLMAYGLPFFRNHPQELLCDPGTCQACDERWEFYLTTSGIENR